MLDTINTNRKQRLIILSDLWGTENSSWITHYIAILKNYYDVKYYDSRILGEIDNTEKTKENLHEKFIQGGVETAVTNLLAKENKIKVILGFSIGGYIAWKACNSGLNTEKLIAVSSTRLRYEKQKPSISIELIYGEEDTYKPSANWFKELNINPTIFNKLGHDLYRRKKIAKEIAESIIENRLK